MVVKKSRIDRSKIDILQSYSYFSFSTVETSKLCQANDFPSYMLAIPSYMLDMFIQHFSSLFP